MEHWHTTTSIPYQAEGNQLPHSSRVLTTTSGNVQTYALDSKEGIENQNPFPPGRFSTKQESKPELHFPIPKIKLGSNDQSADNLLRLQARRQHHRERFNRHRRPNPERPYLQHPKYLQYRDRQRCDTGPDGKPVWDDRIEDAFQNALVNIEPMGRRKKSQRGRPYGRNELISEWILQETGEHRSRKQVSSHIQVLNTLLRGIPEWDALITASEASGSDRPGHEYYSDSIEQMVRSQNSLGANLQYHRAGSRLGTIQTYMGGTSGGFVDKHNMNRLSFEMWVSLPNQMDQALHIYSRLQSSNATSVPMPLEDIKNWRVSFPSLRPVVDTWSVADSCDIILLEASFQLMSDFPPKFSKLGISLELDFLHSSNNNGGSLAALDDWSCRTHMFQHGRLVKEVAHDDCHVAGLGKVKPFFESKWWASTFTQLTEKRKMAEDSKSDGAIELANEYSRNFFHGLTVMQEISAGTMKGHGMKGIWNNQPPRRRRMAILLWKFSQAPNGFVGTTAWHKVIPPPERITMNSPPPQADMALPPLTMDTVIGGTHVDNLFDTSTGFLHAADQQQYNIFSQSGEGSLYQNTFMEYKSGSMAGFDDSPFDLQPSQIPMDHDMNIAFDIPTHELPQFQNHTVHTTTNLFELPQLKNDTSEHEQNIHMISRQGSFNDNEDQTTHERLAKFDMNTHKMLQAQLGTDDDPFYAQPHHRLDEVANSSSHAQAPQPQQLAHANLDEDDKALRAALLAASAMSDLGNQTHSYAQPTTPESHSDPQHIPTSHPFTSPSTLAVRPPLQTHHSFAGTGSAEHNFHSRHSSRNNFASVLTNLQAYSSNQDVPFSLDFITDDAHHSMNMGMGISRPQSQPVLPAAAVDALYEELMAPAATGLAASQPQFQSAGAESQTEEFSTAHEQLADDFVILKHEDVDDVIGALVAGEGRRE